jgi:hypothetical protein
MTQKSKLRAKLQRLGSLAWHTRNHPFFQKQFFSKNKKFKNEVIFKGFPSPEVRGKK